MNLIAKTFNGMHETKEIPVTSISAWIDRNSDHSVSATSINALLEYAKKSGQMQIYSNCIVESLDGKIDAYDGTPLYTNGQESVRELILDGKTIWKRF